MTWLLDMDGVIWRGTEPISGSADAVRKLGHRGVRVGFVTNNSSLTTSAYASKLATFDIETSPDNIVTSALSTATLLQEGERVLCIAGDGVMTAAKSVGAEVVDVDDIDGLVPPTVDVVVVANRPKQVNQRELTLGTRAVLAGARLIVPNADPLYPREDGFGPGTGAYGSAIAYATGVKPQFAGKPTQTMVDVIRDTFPDITVFVGDQVATDGVTAQKLGVPFTLVRTGVAGTGAATEHPDVPVAHDVADLSAAVDAFDQ